MDVGLAPLTPRTALAVASGLAMFALALWLWHLHPRLAVNRALAAFLFLRGTSNAFVPVTFTLERAPGLTFTLGETVDLFLTFALVPFVLAYRRHQHGATPSRLWTVALAAGAVVVAAVWLYDPSLGSTHNDPALVTTTVGPLLAVMSFSYWGALLATAIVLVRDATVDEHGPAQTSNLLLSFALLAWPVHFAAWQFFDLASGFALSGDRLSVPWYAFLVTPWLAAVSAGGVVATIALYVGARWRGRPRRAVVRRYAVAALLPLLTAVVPTYAALAGVVQPASALNVLDLFAGVWLLAMPVIAAYALVRHQLFGVDAKVKLAVRQSTVAAAFVGVFFVVSEGAATFLSGRWGPLLGIAAAGALVFALAPLQRVAERVANAAMPGVKATPAMDAGERAAIYRDQMRFAWADRTLTSDERRLLNELRERLGLTAEEALRIENDVLGE